MENLTQRQQQVLDFITRSIETNGAPPTLREISAHIGTRGTVTALHHIEAIGKKGYLRRREGSARGIVLTGKAARSEALVSLPIVGTVSAGLPQPAVENIEGYCAISPEWAGRPPLIESEEFLPVVSGIRTWGLGGTGFKLFEQT